MHPQLAPLARTLDELEPWVGADLEARCEQVSAWCVGEQVDHTLKVAAGILQRLAKDGKEAETGISLTGRLILALGWMPRGVGKAPEFTLPARPAASELLTSLEAVRGLIERLEREPARLRGRRRVLRHPRFGGLTPAQALRFAAIHTRHHLKILRDIERGARISAAGG